MILGKGTLEKLLRILRILCHYRDDPGKGHTGKVTKDSEDTSPLPDYPWKGHPGKVTKDSKDTLPLPG